MLDKAKNVWYSTSCSAGVAHLVERHLAKVEVASSSLVARSKKRGHNVCCDLFFGFRQEIKMLGRSEFALRQGFAAQNACTAQKRRFFGSSGQRVEQGVSEARKRPGGAFVARCACRGTAVPRASLVARSKKEVTTYVVTSFLDSGRKLKCSGEVNSPSTKVLLRKTLVRRKSVVFCFGRPNRYGTSELGVLFFIRTFPVND